MKHFKVVMYVTNCENCPYSDMDGNENYICTVSEADSITSRQLEMQIELKLQKVVQILKI
jgi:hypothetical protein